MIPTASETASMPLVRVRERAQITLPQELRDALQVKQGDYLEAQLVPGGLLLKPMAVLERTKARQQFEEALASVRYVGDEPEPSDDVVMEEAVQDVKETRSANRARRP